LNARESKLIGLDEAMESAVARIAKKNIVPGGVTTGAATGAGSEGIKRQSPETERAEWPGLHGGRVARRGLPAAPEGYRRRARAVHLRLS
jgi:hypothetical protein